MTEPTRIRFSARTHIGKVRKLNEDSIIAMPDQRIWAVSDGMGGHAAGDFASQCVTGEIATIPTGLGPAETLSELRSAIGRAHGLIVEEAARRGGATIGATVVALVLSDGHFAALWAGDSRLYKLSGGRIEMLSHDHSFVAGLVENGELTWDEAELHPRSNEILRAVGVGNEVNLDKLRGPIFPGDRFLICSDGLSKYATFEMLRRALDGTPIEHVADDLVDLALDGGGADNVSVIVVDVL